MDKIQKLTLGTANLNHMRSDIRSVVSTIGSLLTEDFRRQTQRQVGQKKGPEIHWAIERIGGHIIVACYKQIGRSNVADTLYTYTDKREGLSLEHVAEVRGALESFLDWVLSLFPELKDRLEFIFAAAES